MASVVFVESWDHYATADLTKKWSAATASATVSAGNGRNGTASLRFGAGTSGQTITAALPAGPTFYCELAARFSTAWPSSEQLLFALMDAGTLQCELRLTTTPELRVTRNGTSLGITSGLGLSLGTYYHIGFMVTINDTTGVFEVRLNGVQKLFMTAQDTKNTANATANQFRIHGMSQALGDYDDLVISTDDWCGDCRVKAVFPDSAGNYSEWTPSAGLGWQCVDEPSMNSDTDYVSSATVGQRNSYGFGALGLTGTVKAVQHVTSNRKDDAGSRTIKQFARIGGTDYDGSAVSVADAYVMSRRVMSVSPATGSAWTVSEIDGMEAGTKLES